ncbi:MAG: DUF1684 domain-containing protein [Chloroflexi bacterium]|nr:DUF1684 domain-containing protein [Chloroflexota bacterium]
MSSAKSRDRLTQLLDYRRRVAALYADVRTSDDPAFACAHFRRERDELFRAHPQAALDADARARFATLRYYDYDPAYRFVASLEPAPDVPPLEVALRDDGLLRMTRIGQVRFEVVGTVCVLSVYWLLGYGGGVFLPFRDATSRDETYEGGRYLLDTIKGADLGSVGNALVLDFNFAYNPSCAYDPVRWVCPLAPRENWLTVRIEAGEQRFGAD